MNMGSKIDHLQSGINPHLWMGGKKLEVGIYW
jgi:hypothetical protein